MQTLTDRMIAKMRDAAGEVGDYGTCALAYLAMYGWQDMIDYIRLIESDEDADIDAWFDDWLPTVPRPLTMEQARATLAEQHQAFLDELAEFADILDAEDAMAEIEALSR